MKIRTGFGYDVHKLVEGRELWLGGIKLDYELGLLGHSDADVLIHAICDALLGAANMRDIGYHFPDTAAETLNVDSKILLAKTIDLIATKGYRLGNVDATVCAERPKLNPHIPQMQQCLAEVMHTDVDNVSIKATTTEKTWIHRTYGGHLCIRCGAYREGRLMDKSKRAVASETSETPALLLYIPFYSAFNMPFSEYERHVFV